LGKPKAFQVEEDKILAEVTLSTIYRRMPLIWKGVEEGSLRLYKIIPIKGNHPRTWRECARERVECSLVQKV
jgi:hypothetical protein